MGDRANTGDGDDGPSAGATLFLFIYLFLAHWQADESHLCAVYRSCSANKHAH